MFATRVGVLSFLGGLLLTVGLLMTPTLVPGGFGYRAGLAWSAPLVALAVAGGLGVLAFVLALGGRWVRGARAWNEPRVIAAAVLIAITANTLYMFAMDLFGLGPGWRALVAALGVPVIYGNLAAVLGKTRLRTAMQEILAGALATLGAAFIVAALLRGWR